MRRFEKHMGRSEVGSEKCVVYINERDRSVEILLYSRPFGKTIGWTQDGRLDDVKEGEELKPFFTFSQAMYEDFPNIIVVLYKPLLFLLVNPNTCRHHRMDGL